MDSERQDLLSSSSSPNSSKFQSNHISQSTSRGTKTQRDVIIMDDEIESETTMQKSKSGVHSNTKVSNLPAEKLNIDAEIPSGNTYEERGMGIYI